MSEGKRREVLEELRSKVAAVDAAYRCIPRPVFLPFGDSLIDAALPGGGLSLGAVHEVVGAGPEAMHRAQVTMFCAGVLGRLPGHVVWTAPRDVPHSPALASAGLDPGRVIHVSAGDSKTVLIVMEEAIRHTGLAGVVGEVDRAVGLSASRRLLLAAEQSGVMGLLVRRARPGHETEIEPTAAYTRWRVSASPSGPPLFWSPETPGVGRALWKLELLRCRGAEPKSFLVEACDENGRIDLVADLADGPASEVSGHGRAAIG
jgi:protein ImuA